MGCDAKATRYGESAIYNTIKKTCTIYKDFPFELKAASPASWPLTSYSQEELLQPHGRVSFAGEYANKVTIEKTTKNPVTKKNAGVQ